MNKLITLILILAHTALFAQTKSVGLQIGDVMPKVKIPNIINYKSKSATYTDFENDLVIIDFWGRGCKSCVEALPRMEHLQNKYRELTILAVTDEREGDIEEFWKHNKYTKKLKNPSVVEDTIFKKLFRHIAIPHEVWIYKGIIIGITPIEYVDDYNIQKVLAGNYNNLNWPVKNDFLSYDMTKPIFSLTSDSSIVISQSYSAVGGFKENISSPIYLSAGSGIERDSMKRTVRTYFLNQPILNTYIIYYIQLFPFQNRAVPSNDVQPNQISWEVKDKTKYAFIPREGEYVQNWLTKYGICFESLYPDTGQNDKQIYASVVRDLNKHLRINVRWVKRKESVWVLRKAQSTRPKKTLQKKETDRQYSIYDIVTNLNNQESNPYIFNESNDNRTMITLTNKTWLNIKQISEELSAQGFNLTMETRIIDKLVFSEIKTHNSLDQD